VTITEMYLIKYVVQHVLWISGPGLCFEGNRQARPSSAAFASLVFPVLLAFIS